MSRKSGVLMHISSLFGDYSIGSFGESARKFIDFLADSKFKIWQVLPFCMTDEFNSPYKSFTSFGANPYFIDLDILREKEYITEEELLSSRQNQPYLAEYDRLAKERLSLLKKASDRMKKNVNEVEKMNKLLSRFPMLEEAANFLALRESNGGEPWQKWFIREATEECIFTWRFIQYEFLTQWLEIKKYANAKGVEIIGDVPIYVALDSADVWAHPEEFLLDENHYPTDVAGVPPDYFSEEGQLWGNPLYNWKRMKADGFSWWKKRIEYMLTLFDGVRIDHFRGFEAYWAIPNGSTSAKKGKWVKGPGRALVDAIREVAGDKLIIAEDLGDITEGVKSLLKYSKLPGMRVLQFAFLGDENTPHLPHNYCENTVAYSGTHDNNTLLGYVWELDNATRGKVFDYCGYNGTDFGEACLNIIKTLLGSAAETVIFPIQDLLVYGSDTRMNTPGVSNGNWAYRITKEQFDSLDRQKFSYLNKLYGRG